MKKTDWLQQLLAFIASRKDAPYAWGSNDCCLFAADAIVAMTGTDLAAKLRGTYSNEEGAYKIIADHGSLAKLITSFLGTPLGPLCARRGDIVLFHAPNGADCVGVCTGPTLVCPGDENLNTFSMELATKSWRIN